MRLEDLARLRLPQPDYRVPIWTLGSWRRRSITFANGSTDLGTRVFWLQSGGLTADLRLPARRFETTSALACALLEGGAARTAWDGTRMSWSEWTSFQLHDKWPEPAHLTRIGDCLIEIPPSGIYVEEWRLQPSEPGLLAGLRLIEERDVQSGAVLHRGGCLIVTGDHAALVKGRPRPLHGATSVKHHVEQNLGNAAVLTDIFAFEASYATRSVDGAFVVAASTRQEHEEHSVIELTGFSLEAATGRVRQAVREGGRDVERLFEIDTLEEQHAFPLTTRASESATRWLSNERETLLRDAGPLPPMAP